MISIFIIALTVTAALGVRYLGLRLARTMTGRRARPSLRPRRSSLLMPT